MAKQKNEPASGGKINVNVDVKLERFGTIQSANTIDFRHTPEKQRPEKFVAVPTTTVITKLIDEPDCDVLTD